MKRTLLIAALATILSTSAQAHIGWSLSDCLVRYGPEVKASKNTNSGEIHYFSNRAAEMTLSVILRNDKVKSIIYRKAGEKFGPDEIDILQKLNQKEILGYEGIKWTEQTDSVGSMRVWVLSRDGDPSYKPSSAMVVLTTRSSKFVLGIRVKSKQKPSD